MRGSRATYANPECGIPDRVRGYLLSGIGKDELCERLPGVSEQNRKTILRWYATTYMDRLRSTEDNVGRLSSDKDQLVLDLH